MPEAVFKQHLKDSGKVEDVNGKHGFESQRRQRGRTSQHLRQVADCLI